MDIASCFKANQFFCFWIGYTPLFIIVKADGIKKLLVDEEILDKGWIYDWVKPWIGSGLLISDTKKWKPRRKLLNTCFRSDILKDFIPTFNEKSQILVEKLLKDSKFPWVDVLKHTLLCSLDILCETILGINARVQDNNESEYVKAAHSGSRMLMQRILHPSYWLDFTFYHFREGRQFKKDLEVIHNFTKQVIAEKKQLFLSEANGKLQKKKALMDFLIDHHLTHGTFTESDIQEEVDTFTIEGFETTALTVAWTLYLVGLHPEVQQKIEHELTNVFGEDYERTIFHEDLKELKYLECVIKESARLYPTVPIIGREANKDILLDGYKIPKGSMCLISSYHAHRDSAEFPHPLKFDPERFFPENSKVRHPFAYVPFSTGPRNCIGQRFAMLEAKVMVATILRKFQIVSLTPRDKMHPSLELSLRPKEIIKIKLIPKSKNEFK